MPIRLIRVIRVPPCAQGTTKNRTRMRRIEWILTEAIVVYLCNSVSSVSSVFRFAPKAQLRIEHG